MVGNESIEMGVIFVKELPRWGDEPFISSIGYEPMEIGVIFIKELSRWG